MTIKEDEEARKMAAKYIVTMFNGSDTWYMCKTNWALCYSAGVMEFVSASDALLEAERRNVKNPVLYVFNKFGERIN